MIFTFRLTLTSTPQQLPKVVSKFNEIRLSTPSGNAGVVYLADTPANAEAVSNRFAIAAGKEFPLKISDLSQLWADGTSGDYLDMITETDSTVSEQVLSEQGGK